MNIRNWFGRDDGHIATSALEMCVDELLVLYAKAISRYFNVELAVDAKDFIARAKENSYQSPPEDKMFLKWFTERGLDLLKGFACRELPESQTMIHQIDYVKFILEEEMDFADYDNVRSCLVDTATLMQERIDNVILLEDQKREQSSKEIYLEISYILKKEETDGIYLEDFNYIAPNIKEPGNMQALLY